MKRQICSECDQPIFVHGLSGNRLLTVCQCGNLQLAGSSYDTYPALTLDPDNPDYRQKPVMREISGDSIIQEHWHLALEELQEAMERYPDFMAK